MGLFDTVEFPKEKLFHTVGYIEDVKVIESLGACQGMPSSSRGSHAYIKLYPNGTFRMMRVFDEDRCLYLEIAYHYEPSLTGKDRRRVLHYHTYEKSYSMNNRVPSTRSSAQPITESLLQQYGRYFQGVEFDA